jgi:hypothetical protein
MARKNTKLESEGAEFLVLGQLLIHGMSAYKTYTNMPGYDVVAINPDRNTSARISVKSRWDTSATGFIIKNFNCDFVVVAKLNRGTKRGKEKVLPPEFFVLPTKVVKDTSSGKGWGRIEFGTIPNFKSYADRWDLIRDFLYGSERPKSGLLSS